MGRWKPDARGRLEQAAMSLYAERGYENVTVAEIAARAGLTERTFFRHFADKREVLFAGGTMLQDMLVASIDQAPETLAPIEIVATALERAGEMIGQRGDFGRRRQRIIAANAELRERELVKLASMADALAEALRGRGVGDPAATLAAEVGMAVFRTAFQRWVDEDGRRELADVIADSFGELGAVTARA